MINELTKQKVIMKNLIKYILILVIGGVFLSSCEEQVSNWNAMTNDYDDSNY